MTSVLSHTQQCTTFISNTTFPAGWVLDRISWCHAVGSRSQIGRRCCICSEHISSRKHLSLNLSPDMMESLNNSGNMFWKAPTHHTSLLSHNSLLLFVLLHIKKTLNTYSATDNRLLWCITNWPVSAYLCVILIPPATTVAYFYLFSVFVFTCWSVKNTTAPRL